MHEKSHNKQIVYTLHYAEYNICIIFKIHVDTINYTTIPFIILITSHSLEWSKPFISEIVHITVYELLSYLYQNITSSYWYHLRLPACLTV